MIIEVPAKLAYANSEWIATPSLLCVLRVDSRRVKNHNMVSFLRHSITAKEKKKRFIRWICIVCREGKYWNSKSEFIIRDNHSPDIRILR